MRPLALSLTLLAISFSLAQEGLIPPTYPTDLEARAAYLKYEPGELQHMLELEHFNLHLHLNTSFEYEYDWSPHPFWAFAPSWDSDVCHVSVLWLPHLLGDPWIQAWLIMHEIAHCYDVLLLDFDHNGVQTGNDLAPDYPAAENYANAFANLWLERHRAMHGPDSLPVTWPAFAAGVSVIDTSAMPDPREICVGIPCDFRSAPWSYPPPNIH